jgi:hypothetical protein
MGQSMQILKKKMKPMDLLSELSEHADWDKTGMVQWYKTMGKEHTKVEEDMVMLGFKEMDDDYQIGSSASANHP